LRCVHTNCGGMEAAAGCVLAETGACKYGLICMHTNFGGMEAAAGCVETDGGRDELRCVFSGTSV
jgi:hypothetical protein